MKKIVRLTEKDLSRLVKKVINEGVEVIHTPEQLIKNLESQPNKSATIYVEDKSLKVKYSNGSIVGLECENTPVIKEQVSIGDEKGSSIWNEILKGLGQTTNKHIKMKDGGYSLNWGSHSGPGYDWGLSIDNDGTFSFQTENPKKSEMIKSLIQKNSLPFVLKSYEPQGIKRFYIQNEDLLTMNPATVIQFVKDIISNLKK